jgi:hypothetical protein
LSRFRKASSQDFLSTMDLALQAQQQRPVRRDGRQPRTADAHARLDGTGTLVCEAISPRKGIERMDGVEAVEPELLPTFDQQMVIITKKARNESPSRQVQLLLRPGCGTSLEFPLNLNPPLSLKFRPRSRSAQLETSPDPSASSHMCPAQLTGQPCKLEKLMRTCSAK